MRIEEKNSSVKLFRWIRVNVTADCPHIRSLKFDGLALKMPGSGRRTLVEVPAAKERVYESRVHASGVDSPRETVALCWREKKVSHCYAKRRLYNGFPADMRRLLVVLLALFPSRLVLVLLGR